MPYIQAIIGSATKGVIAWARNQQRKSTSCRACDYKVSVVEKICPRCGVSDPARVPLAGATAVFGTCAIIIIVAFAIC